MEIGLGLGTQSADPDLLENHDHLLGKIEEYERVEKQKRQRQYIQDYLFHPVIIEKLKEKYPTLTNYQLTWIFQGLRDYFFICNLADKKLVSMPSKIVDDAWHEFILCTHEYEAFCQNAFNHFLHHTPSVRYNYGESYSEMLNYRKWQEGINLAWQLTCQSGETFIDYKNPQELPLLFAIDAALAIPDGFHYSFEEARNPANADYELVIGRITSQFIERTKPQHVSNNNSSKIQGSNGEGGGGSCGGGC